MPLADALQQLAYKNLFSQWLESQQQNTPQGFNPVQSEQGAPQNYFLKPEDMMAALNAASPYDLYMKPDISPKMLDYPTSAFNINNQIGNMGIPQAILMASQSPQSQLSNLMSMQDSTKMNYGDIPQQQRRNVPQGIYQHEVAHYQDPRLNPMANNYGYLVRAGLPGNIASREIPAMRAEDRFWDMFRNQMNGGR